MSNPLQQRRSIRTQAASDAKHRPETAHRRLLTTQKSGRCFDRSMGREGGGCCIFKVLQPFLCNICSLFCLRQLLPELFSQELARFQLFLQKNNLLICLETFWADTLGQGECVRSDALRFVLDTCHRPGCAANHFKRFKVVARLRRCLVIAGKLYW
jgi:hypothetical protein